MAYRDPTFNANILTDLLSTYLTHQSSEREKYYKAEQQANKPIYRTLGNSLYEIKPGTGQSREIIKGETTPRKPLQVYDPETGGKKWVSYEDAINQQSEKPPVSIQDEAMGFLEGYKNKYPDIDVSDIESNLEDVDTKEEYTFLRGELGKRETRDVANKKGGQIATARNTIKANANLYNKLGDNLSALSGESKKWDYSARKREKKALQSTMNAYGINKQVYLKEDLPKLKEEYLKLIPKSPDTESNIEKIKKMNADELFDEIERMEEKHGIDLPFWLHRERYKGFNEFENLLNSMENVTK
jgi:predicted transcriptional regulator